MSSVFFYFYWKPNWHQFGILLLLCVLLLGSIMCNTNSTGRLIAASKLSFQTKYNNLKTFNSSFAWHQGEVKEKLLHFSQLHQVLAASCLLPARKLKHLKRCDNSANNVTETGILQQYSMSRSQQHLQTTNEPNVLTRHLQRPECLLMSVNLP